MHVSTPAVLLVEDNPDDTRLVRHMLRNSELRLHAASSLDTALRMLAERSFDVALLDLDLVDSRGLETYRLFHDTAPHLPVIVFTGHGDEDIAVEAVRLGAQDYLVKGEVSGRLLERSILYSIERMRSGIRLSHLNRVLMAVRGVNQLIVQERSPAALVRMTCDILVETRGYGGVWIVASLGDGSRLSAARGARLEKARFLEEVEAGRLPPCHEVACSLADARTVRIQAESCRDCCLGPGPEGDVRVLVKLEHGGSIYGVLGVETGEKSVFETAEEDLLVDLAGDIALALHGMELERQQRQIEEQYQQLVESMPAGVAVYEAVGGGRDFVVRDMNPAGCRICRVERDDIVGQRLTRAFPGVTEMGLLDVFRDVNATGDPAELAESRYQDSRLSVMVENRVFKISNGQIVAIFDDVTERHRARAACRQSELNYRTLFNSASDLLVVHDTRTGDPLDINDQAVATFGPLNEDGDGAGEGGDAWFRGPSPYSRNEALEHIRLAAERKPQVFEWLCRAREGRDFWAEISLKLIDVGSGRRVLAAIRDISERKRAEAELRAATEKLRSIVENIGTGISMISPEMRVLEANSQMREWFPTVDLDSAAICYRMYNDPPREAPCSYCPTVKTLRDGKVHQAIKQTPFGEETRHFRIVSTPVRSESGQILAAIKMVEDVTEQHRLRTQVALSDRLATVGLLAAGVAHEINNPLTYILHNLECVSRELPVLKTICTRVLALLGPEGLAAALEDIHESFVEERLDDLVKSAEEALGGVHRVRDIVRDLRTFSRADQDRIVQVSLNEVIEGALNMASNEIKYRAKLVKDLRPIPMLMCNDGKLAQVFLNVLINAAHAIPEGDVDNNEIRIRTRLDGEFVVAEISDTGCGIRETDLPRVFDPFFTTKDVGAGSGLGLSICHNIVSSLGGTITVESTEGRGASFTLRFPVSSSPAEAEPISDRAGLREAPYFGGRILVVDDEPHVGNALVRLLEGEHEVVIAESGAAAIAILEADAEFDAVICDLMMPDVTGMDLYDWIIRERPALRDVMIFMSGGAFTPKAREFLSVVDNPALEKPLDPRELKTRLGEVVSRARASRG